MKTCRRCNTPKPLADFPPYKKMRDGLNSLCRECDNERKRAAYQKNKDRYSEYTVRWQKKNPERWAEIMKHTNARVRANMRDCYVRKLATSRGFSAEEIEQNPDIFESIRQELKSKRDKWNAKPKKVKMKYTNNPDYMSREEVCAYLRISIRTLQLWKADGKLTPVKIHGRVFYNKIDVNTLINE